MFLGLRAGFILHALREVQRTGAHELVVQEREGLRRDGGVFAAAATATTTGATPPVRLTIMFILPKSVPAYLPLTSMRPPQFEDDASQAHRTAARFRIEHSTSL